MTVKEDTVQQSHDEGMAVAVAVEAVSSVELSSQSMMPISTATMGVAASSAAASSSLGASNNMVKVIAPETLPGGAVFEAYVDGIKFNATVPEGGIGEGGTLLNSRSLFLCIFFCMRLCSVRDEIALDYVSCCLLTQRNATQHNTTQHCIINYIILLYIYR